MVMEFGIKRITQKCIKFILKKISTKNIPKDFSVVKTNERRRNAVCKEILTDCHIGTMKMLRLMDTLEDLMLM